MIISAVSPRIHKNHDYGGAYLKPCYRTNSVYIFINVPKCASTWMLTSMEPGFFQYNWKNNKIIPDPAQDQPEMASRMEYRIQTMHKKFFTALRDPIERWVSAIAQAKIVINTNISWEQVVEKTVHDNHSEPQVSFLDALDTNEVTWFYVDKNLQKNYHHYIMNHQPALSLPNIDGANPYNETARKDTAQQKCKQDGIDFLNKHSKYKQYLQDFYKADYDLINTVSFYEAR